MKKITKGTIAAGAAVTLLLGSGGTLAYWNSTANGGEAVISAGNLEIAQPIGPTWTLQHNDGGTTAVDEIADVRIVPGDRLTYNGTFVVTAEGDNLAFTADVVEGSIAAVTEADPADLALADLLTDTAEFTVNGAAGPTGPIPHNSASVGTHDVLIEVTLTWPIGDENSPATDNPAKTGEVDLSDFAVTVTQVQTAAE